MHFKVSLTCLPLVYALLTFPRKQLRMIGIYFTKQCKEKSHMTNWKWVTGKHMLSLKKILWLTFAISNKNLITKPLKPRKSSFMAGLVKMLASLSINCWFKKYTKFLNSIHDGLLTPQYLKKTRKKRWNKRI